MRRNFNMIANELLINFDGTKKIVNVAFVKLKFIAVFGLVKIYMNIFFNLCKDFCFCLGKKIYLYSTINAIILMLCIFQKGY